MIPRAATEHVPERFASECVDLQETLGCKLHVVFDGDRPPVKEATSASRRIAVDNAERQARALLRAGHMESLKRLGQDAVQVSHRMVETAMQACKARGIACMRAPMEVTRDTFSALSFIVFTS